LIYANKAKYVFHAFQTKIQGRGAMAEEVARRNTGRNQKLKSIRAYRSAYAGFSRSGFFHTEGEFEMGS
jgi:hypothetical protein